MTTDKMHEYIFYYFTKLHKRKASRLHNFQWVHRIYAILIFPNIL